MSTSMRSRRMARNHRRMAAPPKLNLVALMDIFTILVLFLIVNNGDVEVLQSDKRVTLPESISEQRPEATLIIKVTEQQILVAERPVLRVDEALARESETLAELSNALSEASAQLPPLRGEAITVGRPVVVMGTQATPYALLKRVLASCAASPYRDVSLAVNSKPVADGAVVAMANGIASNVAGPEL